MQPGGSPPGKAPDGSCPVRITILGTSFTVRADEDPDYLQDVIDFYGNRVREISRSFSQLDPLKIAILTGVLIADDLIKARGGMSAGQPRGTPDQSQEVERITRRLIETLDHTLGNS